MPAKSELMSGLRLSIADFLKMKRRIKRMSTQIVAKAPMTVSYVSLISIADGVKNKPKSVIRRHPLFRTSSVSSTMSVTVSLA